MNAAVYSRRRSALKAELERCGLEGLLVTNLTSVRYLSGFTGSAATCLITLERQSLITDGRYAEQSRREVQGFKRYIGSENHLEIARRKGIAINGLKLGYEGDHLSVNRYRRLKKLFPAVTWEATSRLVERIAAVKDSGEVEALRTAVEITELVFQEILPLVRAGVTEKEIAAQLVLRYRQYGEGESYPPIVAGGPNGALPHAVPTDRPLAKGDLVVIDAAAKYAGYHADLTRTPVIGKASGKQREVYAVVREAQRRGIDAACAGRICREVDQAVRDYITEQGYGEAYSHSSGHGLGLEIHTPPKLGPKSNETLQENNVVTVEPGIYLPGWGGIRIEDVLLIAKDSSEVLTSTSRDLLELD